MTGFRPTRSERRAEGIVAINVRSATVPDVTGIHSPCCSAPMNSERYMNRL